ncbi:MAG TPA: sigma-70 family RNA polymerase sigma factor [Dehalococcoidia bacterium]|jgi:RNA polymerase sigma-70 factor (ECF subfamily)
MMGEQAVPAPRAFEREDELASALVACDARAWRQLFEEQYDRVYAYAYVRTGNTADADDIASITFTEAVKSIRRFDYRGTPVAAWLFRIAHHETVDLLKRRKRMQTDALDEADGRQARGEDAIVQAGQRRDIAEAMTQLNDDQRAVVVLRLVEGCSVAEAAVTLGKSEGAVKVTQMRALRKLRRVIEG